jgi:hypothetical protein
MTLPVIAENKLFAAVFAKLMGVRSPACSCFASSSWTIPLWEICLILPPRIDYMELCNTGSFATFPGSQPHRESSIKPSRRVLLLWTNVKGEVGNLLGLGISNRDITESFPTFKHTVSCTKTPCEIWRYLNSILLVTCGCLREMHIYVCIFLSWSTELELIGFSPIYIHITSLSQPYANLCMVWRRIRRSW